MPVNPDDIIVTCGGSEAILFALEACIQPGEELIIPEPFYANYFSFSYVAGVKVKPIVSVIENGFSLPPVAEFEKLIGPETRGIFIRSEEHTSELQSLMRISYAVFCLTNKKHTYYADTINRNRSKNIL